jgi:recombination protein RecA
MAKKQQKKSERLSVEEVVELFNKTSDENSKIILMGADFNRDIPVTSFGVLSVDIASGVGGMPNGRIIEVYGPESCISGDSFLQYEVWTPDDKKRINKKGGSISRLYERFHNIETEECAKQGRHLQLKDVIFYIKSVDDNGSIIRNRVLDVVDSGDKECIKLITESGESLKSTLDHKYLTPNGYKSLRDLKIGDTVFVHNNTRRVGRKYYKSRPEVCVKYHPRLPTKIVFDKKTGNDYLYYRGQKSRLVYEAFMNDLDYDTYISILNTGSKHSIEKLRFLPDNIHVHHRDEDFTNNDIRNLQLVSSSEHGIIHSLDRKQNLSFVMVETKIEAMIPEGILKTYDLRCLTPYNNYIANGIVVHNSGKTTLAIHAMAEAQRKGNIVAFFDLEHALDKKYCEKLGVDIPNLLLSQPGCAEDALDGVEALTNMLSEGDLIVVDSVAALTPRAEIEGDMGDSHMGLQARLMSQACRKLTGIASKKGVTILFINQIRMKIGVMFGSPETTSGGNALKFYASQRIETRKTGTNKGKDGEAISNKVRLKFIKNKVAPPFREANTIIKFGEGIPKSADVMELALALGIIERSGSWYKYEGENIGQGSDLSCIYLEEHPDVLEKIENQIRKHYDI